MKHISLIDNHNNLQAIIRNELRDLGVKVPKPKKTKRFPSKQDVHSGQIFGCHLANVSCVHIPNCGYVAKFLVDAAQIIQQNIDQEGIFRKAGAIARQKEIRQQLEDGNGFVGASIHDVTALVKQFFRELPEPLFTSIYHDTFVQCYQLEKAADSKKAILLLCVLLPPEHISTLRFIMQLLAEIAQHSEKNKMDSNNLAVVLAPNLMHVNNKSETMKSCEEKLLQVQTSVVEFLIQHADEVGMVEEEIVLKTDFMSEVFSCNTTAEDLDATDNNLEENMKRENTKKRKRSGSIKGFVSGVAQSISKWRRSSDVRSNVSDVSHRSNASAASYTEAHYQTDYRRNAYQFPVEKNTPVVKKSVPMTDGKVFSTAKKTAVLKNLPNHETLASTSFTPSITRTEMDYKSGKKRGLFNTPSMPPRPNHPTLQNRETSKKKLALLSPASTTKKKRYSSTSNISMDSCGKKASRNIFKHSGGSKGDRVLQHGVLTNVGHYSLVHPSSTALSFAVHTNVDYQPWKSITATAPMADIACDCSNTSMCDQSVVCSDTDEHLSLNKAVIVTEDKEMDAPQFIYEPIVAGFDEDGKTVMLRDDLKTENKLSNTSPCRDIFNTPNGNGRSCVDISMFDNSAATRKSTLTRGRLHSLKAGPLLGDRKEAPKLHRSFNFCKSDRNVLTQVSVTDMSDSQLNVQLDCSLEYLNNADNNENIPDTDAALATDDNSHVNEENIPGTNSIVATDDNNHLNELTASIPRFTSDNGDQSLFTKGFAIDHNNHYTCVANASNNISEADFSNTVSEPFPFLPKMGHYTADEAENNSTYCGLFVNKSVAKWKQESKDCLVNDSPSMLFPVLTATEPETTKSVDSGEGLICEMPCDSHVALKNIVINAQIDADASVPSFDKDSVMKTKLNDEAHMQPYDKDPKRFIREGLENFYDTDTINKFELIEKCYDDDFPTNQSLKQKSVSIQNLETEYHHMPVEVSRSKSLFKTNLMPRKHYIKPNIHQMSSERHKQVSEAGHVTMHIEESHKGNDSDFKAQEAIPFMQQSETLTPRRESIVALLRNNAGHVKNNIRQFDSIIEEDKDELETSPLHFPNSPSQK